MAISSPTIITFIGYLLIICLLGFYAYKSTNSLSDYVLGGRKLGPGVTALSVGASDMSGWLLLGLPGAIYASGISEIWIGVGLVLGAWLNWLIVAKRLRIQSEQYGNALTIPEYLHNRLNHPGNALRVISAIMTLVFFTLYVSSGMVGGAVLFEKVFGLDYHTALIIGAIVIVSYTFVGGYFAVSWTDFFQGILMLIALVILPTTAIINSGGITPAIDTIEQISPDHLNAWNDLSFIGFISLMAWGLGYFGQPHILARFMAIHRAEDLTVSRRIAMSWVLVSLAGALATGLVSVSYFSDSPLENAETVFIHLTNALLNPWVAGVLIAAIMSAIMSTIDSQLLVCSSVITEDIYKPLINKDTNESQAMWITRGAVIIIAIIATLIAQDPKSSILDLVSYAWAGFGCAFGPVIILSLYWDKLTSSGALASIVTGGSTVIIWKQLEGGVFDMYEMIPGFIAAFVVAGIVSTVTASNNTNTNNV